MPPFFAPRGVTRRRSASSTSGTRSGILPQHQGTNYKEGIAAAVAQPLANPVGSRFLPDTAPSSNTNIAAATPPITSKSRITAGRYRLTGRSSRFPHSFHEPS